MLTGVKPDALVPHSHPIRRINIKPMVDSALVFGCQVTSAKR